MNIPLNSQVIKPSREGKFIEKLTKVYNQVKADMPLFEDYGHYPTVGNMLKYLLCDKNDTSIHPLTKLVNKDFSIILVDSENFEAYADGGPDRTLDGVEYVIMRMGVMEKSRCTIQYTSMKMNTSVVFYHIKEINSTLMICVHLEKMMQQIVVMH